MTLGELGERLQALRRSRGLSQEQLAEQVGVSRQAVSKWELGESVPELDKVLLLSEFFGVTTDYLLKGGQPSSAPEGSNKTMGQVLFICSAGFLAIGLLLAFGGWNGEHPDSAIWGGMMVQVPGLVCCFVGKSICRQEPPFFIQMLDWALGLFMPCAMAVSFLMGSLLQPYPIGPFQTPVFVVLYGAALFLVYRKLKKA